MHYAHELISVHCRSCLCSALMTMINNLYDYVERISTHSSVKQMPKLLNCVNIIIVANFIKTKNTQTTIA